MPQPYSGSPRTRAEEILRARAIMQVEVSQRARVHTSHLSKIISGKVGLSVTMRATLARVLECAESDLVSPIGSPIPPRAGPPESTESGEGFELRARALLVLLGIRRAEGLAIFLGSGDYSGLPPALAHRLREIIETLKA